MKWWLAIFASALIVSPLVAQEPEIPLFHELCFEEPIPGWQPVGCEVIDCCPGCPGFPELVISLEGTPADRLTIDLPSTAGIRTTGNARLTGNRLTIGPGRSTITGFDRAGLAKSFGPARFSGRESLKGSVELRQGDRTLGRTPLAYRFVKCPRGPEMPAPAPPPPPQPGSTTPEPSPLTCATKCATVIKFMTDHDIPAGIGISTGWYREVTGYEYLNIFVRYSQFDPSELPLDLGVIFAFSPNGLMGSRRYVNLESNVPPLQPHNMITVSGANAWHGSQTNVSSYTVRLPVMGPFVQVFPYNKASVPRKVTIWGYASH